MRDLSRIARFFPFLRWPRPTLASLRADAWTGKLPAGFSAAFPVSGSFSRSALNLYAGAVSAWSTLFAAACVLLSLLFLTGYLHYLLMAMLAAIIIVPVLNASDVAGLRRLFSVSRNDGVIALVTFAATMLALPDLYWGVAAGVGLNMVVFLYRRMHPRVIEVGLHPDGTLRDRERFDLPRLAPDLIAVRMDSALIFLPRQCAGALRTRPLPRGPQHPPRAVVRERLQRYRCQRSRFPAGAAPGAGRRRRGAVSERREDPGLERDGPVRPGRAARQAARLCDGSEGGGGARHPVLADWSRWSD
ncbi:MAG TPA: SulP family inorganic anion transporter [Noviherbaspirillum sp.]|nr:SulP family inorganic anion transporter [Noviherbaspirillum sp.]